MHAVCVAGTNLCFGQEIGGERADVDFGMGEEWGWFENGDNCRVKRESRHAAAGREKHWNSAACTSAYVWIKCKCKRGVSWCIPASSWIHRRKCLALGLPRLFVPSVPFRLCSLDDHSIPWLFSERARSLYNCLSVSPLLVLTAFTVYCFLKVTCFEDSPDFARQRIKFYGNYNVQRYIRARSKKIRYRVSYCHGE